MKIIFCDIDGVLNSDTDFFELKKFGHSINKIKGSEVINRGHLALLQQIIEDTDAKIVLSSTWRNHYSLDEIHDMFTVRGFSLPREVFHDITPNLSYGLSDDHTRHRGAEIRDYLDAHPEVDSFVILDDILEPIIDIPHVYEDSQKKWDEREPYKSFVKVDLDKFITDDKDANFIHTNHWSGLTVCEMYRAIQILGKNESAQKKEDEYNESLDLLMSCMI